MTKAVEKQYEDDMTGTITPQAMSDDTGMPDKKRKRKSWKYRKPIKPVYGKGDMCIGSIRDVPGAVSVLLEYPKRAVSRVRNGFCDRDTWDIDNWFITVMRAMLKYYKANRYGSPACLGSNYYDENGVLRNDGCHEAWDRILSKMIFLLGEMDENVCRRKNPYENEWFKADAVFTEKYGVLGEKLNNDGGRRIHFMGEVSEFKEIDEKYMDYEKRLDRYRNRCKDEFFKLFSKYFWHLWG